MPRCAAFGRRAQRFSPGCWPASNLAPPLPPPLPHPQSLHSTFLLFLVLVVAPLLALFFPAAPPFPPRSLRFHGALRFSTSCASLAQAEPPPHTLHTPAVQYTAPHLACYRTRNPNNLPNVSPVPNQPTKALPRRKHLSSLSPPCLFPPSRRAYPSTPPQHFPLHPPTTLWDPLALGHSTFARCVSTPVCNPLNSPSQQACHASADKAGLGAG